MEDAISIESLEEVDTKQPVFGRLALSLVAAAVLCLVAAGGLMWWHHGASVFDSLVTSALALCF